MNERQPARLVLRIEHLGQRQRLVGRDRRPDLHADGIGDAAEVFDVRAVQRARPLADPGEVGREIIPARAARHLAGLGLLVVKVQPLVAGEEIHAVDVGQHAPGERLHEAQRLADGLHHARVLGGVRRIGHEAQAPVFRMVQVGKAAFDQRANEVNRQAGPLVSAKQQLGIRACDLRG